MVYAVTTLITNIVWYFMSLFDLREMMIDFRDGIYLILISSIFVLLVFLNRMILPFVIYIIVFFVLTFILQKDALHRITEYAVFCVKKTERDK